MATRRPLWILLPRYLRFIYAVAKAIFWVCKGCISYQLFGKSLEGVQKNPYTWKALKQISNSIHLDVFKTSRYGSKAYNADVVALDGTFRKLFDYKKPGRPLVLNFGSCTGGTFMQEFDNFCAAATAAAEYADFLIVYIEEAHPMDGWAFNDSHTIKKHRKLEDRLESAQLLAARKPPCPIVVDSMTDAANVAYGGLFDRLVVMDENGFVAYEGHRGPAGYRLYEIGLVLAVKAAAGMGSSKLRNMTIPRVQNTS